MGSSDAQFDAMARLIFEQAIKENRCGELLTCLFEGGSATVQPGKWAWCCSTPMALRNWWVANERGGRPTCLIATE